MDNKVLETIPEEMFDFGDYAIIIKDPYAFHHAVENNLGNYQGALVLGDVNYIPREDKYEWRLKNPYPHYLNPNSETNTEYLSQYAIKLNNSFQPTQMDPFTKFDWFANQKEKRLCLLPYESEDLKDVFLTIPDLSKYIEVVPAAQLKKYLLQCFEGYSFGNVDHKVNIYISNVPPVEFYSKLEERSLGERFGFSM